MLRVSKYLILLIFTVAFWNFLSLPATAQGKPAGE